MITIKETCYKGTRILLGNDKRSRINDCVDFLVNKEFTEISIPIIQFQEYFKDKIGEENNNLMFNFVDRGGRDVCLAPEYTAVLQRLTGYTKEELKVFYIQECFRGEKPQEGRYRQFTQFGVEILNPTKDYLEDLIKIAQALIFRLTSHMNLDYYKNQYLESLKVTKGVKRGLDYYTDGEGFEISYELLGAQKQICGGGKYENGVGFAIGVDRVMLINPNENESVKKDIP